MVLENNDPGAKQCSIDYSQYAANKAILTDEDIINLNTYDFMAHLGKRVINPGGLRGRDQLLGRLQPNPFAAGKFEHHLPLLVQPQACVKVFPRPADESFNQPGLPLADQGVDLLFGQLFAEYA